MTLQMARSPNFSGGFGPSLSCALVALALFGATPAFSQSGETEDAVFQVPEEDCEELRAATGVLDGNVIFVCDAERRACQLVEGGRALGFCADRFPEGVEPVRTSPIETAVRISSTTHGTITGFTQDEAPADLVCETFVDEGTGVKACRKVVEDDGEGDGELPDCGDDFFSASNDPAACTTLEELLAQTVAGEPIDISFALFIDVDSAGEPGSEALLVCPGRELQCVPAPISQSNVLADVTVDYQFVKQVIDTPGCVKVGGTCYKY